MKKGRKAFFKKYIILIVFLIISILILFLCGIFIGSSNMSFLDVIKALFNEGSENNIRIIYKIRLPRTLAALLAGCGLALSGVIMQSTLKNDMASPSTLGVSNAAVFGANLSILIFSGGYLATGNSISTYSSSINPYQTSLFAFLFSIAALLLVLCLSKIKKFNPTTIALAGIAIGYIFNAATTIMQYFATDVGLSAAVIWNFGDLGRATYSTDLYMFLTILIGFIFFFINSYKYNAILSGDEVSRTNGINLERFRFISLLIASLISAVCISCLGIIGFVGLIAPQIIKRISGEDHRIFIPSSMLLGGVIVLFADVISRSLGNGSALPIGAITSLIGAPFFLFIIFSRRNKNA